VDPQTYCRHAMANVLGRSGKQQDGSSDRQVLVVLAYFAQQDTSERDFVRQLTLLGDTAERSGRTSLAAAARSVLSNWQTRGRGEAVEDHGEARHESE
jgi:hypothetical protein